MNRIAVETKEPFNSLAGTLRGLSSMYMKPNQCKEQRRNPVLSTRKIMDLCELLQSGAKAAKQYQTHFHGDNTGSNPVGDANRINNFRRNSKTPPSTGDAVGTNAHPDGQKPEAALLFPTSLRGNYEWIGGTILSTLVYHWGDWGLSTARSASDTLFHTNCL